MPITKAATEMDKLIGLRIRTRRMITGISQESLADHLGLTFQQVQKYEMGVNRVGAARLLVIAGVLGVPVMHFYEGAEMTEAGATVPQLSAQAVSVAKDFDKIGNASLKANIAGVIRAVIGRPDPAAAH